MQLVINTPLGRKSHYDEVAIRRAATIMDVGCITTLSGARAAVDGIRCVPEGIAEITSIQSLGPVSPPST